MTPCITCNDQEATVGPRCESCAASLRELEALLAGHSPERKRQLARHWAATRGKETR